MKQIKLVLVIMALLTALQVNSFADSVYRLAPSYYQTGDYLYENASSLDYTYHDVITGEVLPAKVNGHAGFYDNGVIYEVLSTGLYKYDIKTNTSKLLDKNFTTGRVVKSGNYLFPEYRGISFTNVRPLQIYNLKTDKTSLVAKSYFDGDVAYANGYIYKVENNQAYYLTFGMKDFAKLDTKYCMQVSQENGQILLHGSDAITYYKANKKIRTVKVSNAVWDRHTSFATKDGYAYTVNDGGEQGLFIVSNAASSKFATMNGDFHSISILDTGMVKSYKLSDYTFNFCFVGDKIYFANHGLYAAKLDGSDAVKLSSADADKVFYWGDRLVARVHDVVPKLTQKSKTGTLDIAQGADVVSYTAKGSLVVYTIKTLATGLQGLPVYDYETYLLDTSNSNSKKVLYQSHESYFEGNKTSYAKAPEHVLITDSNVELYYRTSGDSHSETVDGEYRIFDLSGSLIGVSKYYDEAYNYGRDWTPAVDAEYDITKTIDDAMTSELQDQYSKHGTMYFYPTHY